MKYSVKLIAVVHRYDIAVTWQHHIFITKINPIPVQVSQIRPRTC